MKTATSHKRTTAMLYARFSLSLGVLLLTALGACARDQARTDPGDTPPPDAVVVGQPADSKNASVLNNPDTAGWTAGVTAKGGTGMATLLEVRTAVHEEYERMVFVFGERLPGYKVEYIDRPVRACGSGEVVDLPGDAWLSVRLEPAQAHTDEGEPTVRERARALGYENVKALRLICDFEAHVEWVAGVASPERYRTLELREPPRLVVDVRK